MNTPVSKLVSLLRRRRRLISGCVIGAGCATAIAVLGGLYWSSSLLTIEHAPIKADYIVVLGGEPKYRVMRAGELFREGLAPRILVSGDGDDEETRRWLINHGVPESAIDVEPNSINTQQNARLSVPLLEQKKAQRVILVTSWFHSRRSLACFQKAAPKIEFISMPTVEDRPKHHWPMRYERSYVLREYVKLAAYWLRYGVSPFCVKKGSEKHASQ